ncbi:MAG TPA: hypothetical protein VGG40_08440 [Solirubrobacterales bacterium]|jgi:hypothetical protein
MAIAAPARRSRAPATAPPPSRTSPPRRRKAAKGAATAPAPARKAAPKGGTAAPARRKAPARAPARKSPARRQPARRATPGSRVAAGGRLIPIAVGRTAVAVRELPDSGLVVQMTRGRAWIAVLGVLLAGIVALNVVTLSFAASSSKIDERNTALEEENSTLQSRFAQQYSAKKMRHEATALGLAMPTTEEPLMIRVGPQVVAAAAQRLAAAE